MVLERVRVAKGLTQLSVHGAHDLAQLGAAGAPVVVGVAAPQAVLADVAPGGRELVDAVLVKARLEADGARVHDVAHGKAQAKEGLREPLRAAAAVVKRQARIDRQQHARDVLRPLLVEAALVQAVA